MGFPGTWMTESRSLAYRVVPKCACSTIGQVMFRSDHGRYFDGDIHDADAGLLKWNQDAAKGPIADALLRQSAGPDGRPVPVFTCVRNPYARILSSFFDKIAGIQRNGRRYRGNQLPGLLKRYGVEVGSPEDGFRFDQVASFRRFLLFARDTIRFRKPMDPDIHWSAQAGHVGTLVAGGGRYDRILWTERFDAGMADVLAMAALRHPVDLAQVPRFNESEGHGPKRLHPVSHYFDDLSRQLMWDAYKRDFQLFGYDFDDPDRKEPVRPIDLDEVHAKLAG